MPANDGTVVAQPVIRVHSTVVNESAGFADVLVTLSAPSNQQVTVNYRDYYDANSGDYFDYAYSMGGLLTFAPGETAKVIRYALIDDTASEGSETFMVNLHTATGGVIGNPYAAVTIAANDGASGTPVASVRSVTVDEKGGRADFVIVLDRPSAELVSLSYATAAGTAAEGTDYTRAAGSVSFVPGETVRVVSVPIVDDSTAEGDELFSLVISSPVGATLGQASASARIVANDAANVSTPVLTAEPVIGDEDVGYVDVVFRLSAPSAQQVSVNYTDDYINSSFNDYNDNYGGTLVFAPGETAKTVRYWLADDTASEGPESFWVRMSTPSNLVIGTNEVLVTIAANDNASGVPNVRIDPVSVDERAGVAIYTVLLDRPSTEVISVPYATVAGTATAGSDFVAQSGTVVFSPGMTVQTITVPILDDALAEPDEFFDLQLTAPANAALAQTRASTRLLASDLTNVSTPVINALPVVVDESAGYAEFVFRLSAPSAQQVSVRYDDRYDAEIWREYSYGGGGTLIFAPGEMAKTIRFAVYDDTKSDPAHSFHIFLDQPTNAVVGNSWVTATIAANDGASGTPTVSVSGVTIDEKVGAATFVLSLSQPSETNVAVNFATADGTATAGADYIASSGTVGFAPGQTTRSITVPIVDDSAAEPDEFFSLVLSTPSGLVIGNASAEARIVANDGANASTPIITIEPVVANEVTGWVDVVVRLSAPSAQQVSVNYSDSTEVSAYRNDYIDSRSGTLVFAPGETAKTIRYGLIDDGDDEGPTYFMVDLASATNAVIGTPSAPVVIAANDGTSVNLPSASVQDIVVDEKSGTARFVLTLDVPSTEVLYFNYATAAGTATAGNDFVARSGVVSLLPGETTATIFVGIVDDTAAEADETFTLSLSAPVGAGLAKGIATARIVANDGANVSTPQITCESVEAFEDVGYIDVVFRLNAPSAQQVSFALSDTYTGQIWQDYSYSNNGTVVFAPGETVKVIRYALVDDNTAEPTETFRINLANPSNATLANTQATVTIIDRDGGPTGSITDNVTGVAIAPVTFTLTFGETVTGLAANDFNVINGSITSVTGSGTTYSVLVAPTPNVEGVLLMTLRMDGVLNAALIGNKPISAAQQIDTIVPLVTSFSPSDEATGVLRERDIVIGFSQAVVPGTGSIVLRTAAGATVASYDVASNTTNLSLSADGRTLTINPSSNLRFDTEYRVEWNLGTWRDAAGNQVAALNSYNFRTLVNTPPTAANANVMATEDTALDARLPAFSDPDTHPVVYELVQAPTRGQVVIETNGNYRYVPTANLNGADSFTYRVRDEEGAANTYTVSLNVTPVNDAPTGTLLITGSPLVGQVLVASSTLADADGLGTFSYQWLNGTTPIAGATQNTYALSANDVGNVLRVRVSYTDAAGTLEVVTSPGINIVPDFNPINGTPGNDSLSGTAAADEIRGLAGNDTLQGLAGQDSLDAGPGRDLLVGGAGNDTLNGGDAIDIADYRGATAVNANLQTGVATLGSDTDTLISIEALFGSSAGDTLRGLNGPANLPGETLRGGAGNDTIDGGSGIDLVEFSGPLSAYSISRAAGTLNITVAHNGGGADGTDSLSNVELLLFSDRLVAFGQRAEEVARVAFALWTPPIVGSPTLFSKGISFYTNEFGYNLDTLCQVALAYWPESGAQTAARLKASIPASSFTTQQLIDIMAANGGVDSTAGRAAAVKAVALDAAMTAQLQATGVLTNGVVATLGFPGESPDYFGPMPG